MRKKLAPALIQLTQDACLKAFWRKRTLRTFLQQHQISEVKLATWNEDESKRDFLFRLFGELLRLGDNSGHVTIFKMARSLAEMNHFPDLENWEDSAEKISAAYKAVARLKSEVDKLNQQIHDTREQEQLRRDAQERQQKAIAAKQSLQKLSDSLSELVPRQGTQEGGYAFEGWFYDLAGFFELPARPAYKTEGRQIDGSLTIDGTTFLIETKFTGEQTGAPDVDTFMTKITRKADNTMGVFVSMAGFSNVAIKEASRDRTPMLLMDYSHFYSLILSGQMSLPDVIRRIKRHASQTGEAFLPVNRFSG